MTAAGATRAMPAVEVAPLSPAVWRVTEARAGRPVVSAAVVALDEAVVVVDTLESARAGKALRAYADELGPVVLVVLTHRHGDHVGGLGAFSDVPVVASAPTCAAIGRGRAPAGGREAVADGRVQVLDCGAAHTEGDLVVLVDGEVLVAGDVVVAGVHPRLRHGDLRGWLAALERLARLHPRVVLPGHGDPGGPELLANVHGYLADLRAGPAEPLPGCPDGHVHDANLAVAGGGGR